MLDIGPDIVPRAAIADKGYDAKSNRVAARARGVCPAIPYRSNAKNKPKFFPKLLYKGRARIEQAMGNLKGLHSRGTPIMSCMMIAICAREVETQS